MNYPEFHRNLGPFSLRRIADHIGAILECNDENLLIEDFNGIDRSKSTDVTFLNDNYSNQIDDTDVKTFIVSRNNKKISNVNKNILRVEDIHLSVAKLSNFFFESYDSNYIDSLKPPDINNSCNFIHENSTISNGVTIGKNSMINSGVRIDYNCSIGENVTMGAGSTFNKDIPNNTLAIGRAYQINKKK